jgi:toxin ParE1/3/4
MSYSVVFTPEAEEHLVDNYRYIASEASPAVAEKFTSGIVEFCEGLVNYPHRSVRGDDIRSGLFVTQYRSRVVVAYIVDDDAVIVIGVFYGGRDFESLLGGVPMSSDFPHSSADPRQSGRRHA